jgi:hypothetical protein
MAPVLQLLAFDHEFVAECDASEAGFGAVLHQGKGSVAFFSKPITPRHAKLMTYERELIGLVQAVKHWHPYLWGTPFLICTDHYSLKFLLDQKLVMIPQHQWASKLLGFDFKVEYKPGATNVVADTLSHRNTPDDCAIYAYPCQHSPCSSPCAMKSAPTMACARCAWTSRQAHAATSGNFRTASSPSQARCMCHRRPRPWRSSWVPLMARLMKALPRHSTACTSTSTSQHPAGGAGLCTYLRHVPAQQIRASSPGGPTSAARRALQCVGRHRH